MSVLVSVHTCACGLKIRQTERFRCGRRMQEVGMEQGRSVGVTIKGSFLLRSGAGLWRLAFWVPVGVRRSKCEQHLYRCCVIFIALLHLLGGISFSVNNQVNCTQTCSGTPANFFFFIVTLTQAIFLSLTPPAPPPTQKKPCSFLHLPSPMSPATPPKLSLPP